MIPPPAKLEQVLTNYRTLVVRRALAARRARTGMTLVEIVVVLAILGLTAALVAPSILARSPAPSDASDVLARARGLAVARGQNLELTIEPSGRWALQAPARSDSVAAGQSRERPGSLVRIAVSPFGSCHALSPLPDGIDVLSTPCSLRNARR